MLTCAVTEPEEKHTNEETCNCNSNGEGPHNHPLHSR